MPTNQAARRTLEQVVEDCRRYPMEAFEFVRHGLNYTVEQIHGAAKARAAHEACHVTGQQLCWGLRNYAVQRYGTIAVAVLAHWNIRKTSDFGRIVFAMIEGKLMQKTDNDDLRDFENVFDFAAAFDPPVRPNGTFRITFKL